MARSLESIAGLGIVDAEVEDPGLIRQCIPSYRLTSLHIYAHALHMHATVENMTSICFPMTPVPAPEPLPSPAFP